MKKLQTLALALFASAAGIAQTTTLCNFDFNGSSSLPASATSTASNITASINGTQANAAYGGTVTTSSAFIQNTTAGNALCMSNSSGTNTQYWTLTLGGSALNTFMAYHIYFQTEHSSTGATGIDVSYSTDGSTYTNLGQTITPGNTIYTDAFVDLSSVNALNGASAIYVRFAANGASGTGTLRIDNLQVQGSLSPFETNGSSITFNGNVTAPTLTVTGDARISGNLSATNISSTGTTSLTTLNVSGNTILNQLNIVQSIAAPKLVTNRITSGDTNGVHIGDSSMTFQSLPTGIGTNTYDNMRSSSGRIAIGNIARAYGVNSIAIGSGGTEADGTSSYAFGTSVQTTLNATRAIALGCGISGLSKMTNATPNSLAVGFNSTVPTLFVGGGNGTVGSIGNVGIGTTTPAAQLDIKTSGTNAGLNISNSNLNVFSISNNGSTAVGSNNNSTYSNTKMLTVNGDVSLANYTSSGGTHSNDGFSALEILGNDNMPSRRGITVDPDPFGDFNLYINSYQSPNGKLAEFNFRNGINTNFQPATTSSDAQNLMTLNQNGELIIPKLPTTSNANGTLKTVLVDANGKLVPGGIVVNTNAVGWILGGNGTSASLVPSSIGTTDANDLPFVTNNHERFRIRQDGHIVVNQKQLILSGSGDPSHGLGIFPGNSFLSASGNSITINGPILYGYDGGALGSNQTLIFGGISRIALRWNNAGQVVVGGGIPQGNHADAVFAVYGKTLLTAAYVNVSSSVWADYVFDKDYSLMPLNEVEKYYKQNKHLPDVPSAKEMEKTGDNIVETDIILLRKIEELTLYVVELEKQVKELKKTSSKN